MKNTNLARNTILLSIGTIMTKGINFLMIPLFSSWLSTEDYGTFDLFLTYIALLIPLVTMSSSDAIFRFSVEKNDKAEKSKYISNGLSINLINTALVIVLILIIKVLIGWEFGVPFIFLLVTQMINDHLQGFMRATKQLKLYSFSSVVTTLGIAIFVTIFVLVFEMGLIGIIWGYTTGYFIGEIFLILLTKYWTFLNFKSVSISTMKKLIRYSFPLIPNNISWWVINVSDRVLINIFLGAASNGIYAIAYKIPNFCASIFNVFSISWQETAVGVVTSKDRNEYYNSIYNATLKTMISLCGGLLTLNFFLFYYLFDNRYFEAKLYTPILITSVIFGALTQYFGGIQISFRRTKENGVTTMLGAVVNVLITLVLIKFIGLYAAAISTVVSNISVTVMRYVRLNNEIHFKLSKGSYFAILYYLYLLMMSYVSNNLFISSINLILASIMFCVFNKEFVMKFRRKLKLAR